MMYRLLPALGVAVVLAVAAMLPALVRAEEPQALPDPPPIERAEGEEPARPAQPQTAQMGEVVPDFRLTDQNDREHALSQYAGKIVVLEWINWRCPAVVAQFRAGTTARLIAKFRDADTDVVWLGVNSSNWSNAEHNREGIAAYEGLNFPVLSDPTGRVGRLMGARVTPELMVIDTERKLLYRGAYESMHIMRRPEDAEVTNYVEQVVDALLGGDEVFARETRPYG